MIVAQIPSVMNFREFVVVTHIQGQFRYPSSLTGEREVAGIKKNFLDRQKY